nr:acyltransferase family protein [Polaribacter septentrionalilitoris]
MSRWKWLYIGLATILFLIRFTGFESISNMYLTSLESISWILGVFGIGYCYLNNPSKLLSYLSAAVYPVYIIHMFVLYLGALLILPLDLHPMLQFIGIAVFTFIVCFLIYEFIFKRVKVLRPLFGLKWKFTRVIQNK